MDRIFNMIIRQVMRRLVNKGIDMGVKKASGAMPGSKPQDPQAIKAQKQAAKAMRRAGRM